MNDIRSPQRPPRPVASRQPPQPLMTDVRSTSHKAVPVDHRIAPPKPEVLIEAHEPAHPSVTTSPEEVSLKKKWSWRRGTLMIVAIVFILGIVAAIGGHIWYQNALSPVSSDTNATRLQVTIETGSTPSQIGDLLVSKQLIRSKQAFDVYTRLNGTQNKLQAGAYRLSPAESTPEIVKHLVSGSVDEFTLTFYPGATLTDTTNKAENKKVDVTTILKRAGYSSEEIAAALKKTYDHPLFADKPASADLEGYVYGETYNFAASATVEDILKRTFDEYQKAIEDNDLVAGFKAQGLNLYQGITLASIIQREVSSKNPGEASKDQKQVAQIFLKRLREGTVLGSDVTYKYAANRFNLIDSPSQDSAYNTRQVKGLPPGPISVPALGALKAVASPATGDYEFFLAGDDGVTYFAHTEAEHEANIRDHCQIGCAE
ncbi:MAG: putative Aminodeoxychorismate lyase [Candidatus Saccharibacteria bacterium]|nr:putative Aminodeoxychorismate lyase [Candidatus Saccharibacteria bacterium]